jgi:hypothetical protein
VQLLLLWIPLEVDSEYNPHIFHTFQELRLENPDAVMHPIRKYSPWKVNKSYRTISI